MDVHLVIREVRYCKWHVELSGGQEWLTLHSVTVETIGGAQFNPWGSQCKGNLTILKRILHLDLAKGNPKRTL
jgi:hypothetical protein